ncbi:MAG: tRNA-binding protein, partial [Rhodospirillaceae bacterium]|nr:tRNA-binding protein [Rhodospirillaceae bacterium]
ARRVGRQAAAVVKFPPKPIGKFMSEILVLGFPDGDGEVVMIQPNRDVPNGGRMF